MSTAKRPAARRGRPPLAWLEAEAIAALPTGTAVSIETRGQRTARTIGRIKSSTHGQLDLSTPYGELSVLVAHIARGRVLEGLYEPGDPVLLRSIDASDWRGGVVRTDGLDVLVEQLDGTFRWFQETDLEPADARDPVAPSTPRGPVPARVS